MLHKAVCFIIMPFGRKPDATGRVIDFDRIYRDMIAPAVEFAGLAALRADEESGAGFIHKLMYERLLMSEFAIADMTILNANVYYELGIRHATRPASTVLTMASDSLLPFDVGPLRAFLYDVDPSGAPVNQSVAQRLLSERLRKCREKRDTDSPLFQLLEGYAAPPIERERTDVFRQGVADSLRTEKQIAEASKMGAPELDALRARYGDVGALDADIVLALLSAYRSQSSDAGWRGVIEISEAMDVALSRTPMVRQQYAMALNRTGRAVEAEAVLTQLISERGPTSETCGMLGRIYKDRWLAAKEAGDMSARGHLKSAIAAYRQGFETDWRDPFPGVNALTLMNLAHANPKEIAELGAVVRYSAKRRCETIGDYWSFASLVEVALNLGNAELAQDAFSDALAVMQQGWHAETTARNLRMLAESPQHATPVLLAIIRELENRVKTGRRAETPSR